MMATMSPLPALRVPLSLLLLLLLSISVDAKESCPLSWIEFSDSCYKFERGTEMQFDAAVLSCETHGALLISVDESGEHGFVLRQLELIAEKAVFANNLEWFTSGDASKGVWGNNAPIKDKKFLSGAEGNSGAKIVYAQKKDVWGWDRAGVKESHPYICEIKLADVHNIIVDDRDYSYGVPNRDFIQQQYRYFHAPHFEEMPRDQIFDEDSLKVNEQPGVGLKLIRNAYARLHCKADGFPFPTYEWWRQVDKKTEVEIDGLYWEQLLIKNDDRYTLTNGLLLINQPSRVNDAGTYFCKATNDYGTARSRQVTLTFGYLKDFTEERETISAKEYDRLVIPCQPPNNFPSISYTWSKETIIGSIDLQNRRIFASQRGNLYIAKAEISDKGDYLCQVKNDISDDSTGQVSKPIPVRVDSAVGNQRAPQIEENFPASFPQNIRAGMDIRLECVAYGDPVPTYSWKRTGDRPYLPRKAVHESFSRILFIPNVQPNDEGSYRCIATNKKGTSERSLIVKVSVVPYFDIPLKDQHIDSGIDLSLSCTGRGDPQPEITWWKNGENIAMNKLDVLSKLDLTDRLTISDDDRVITIAKIRATDKGIFQCRAKNDHGEVWSSSEIRVLSIKPNFEKNPMNRRQIAVVDGSTILVCNPEASPAPKFKWFKDGTGLPENRILKNGNYRIEKVSKADEGEYKCQATNTKGSAESVGRLVVVEKTTIPDESGPSDKILTLDSTEQIECKAETNPILDLTYTWSKNGVLIDAENDRHFIVDYANAPNKLLITDAGFSQNGNYSCIAKTTIDQATSDAVITVHGPPGAPGGITIKKVDRTNVEIQWSPAASHGQEVVTYDVEATTKEDERWRVKRKGVSGNLGEDSVGTATVRDLSPGAEYRFRIVAYNNIGRGEESLPSGWVKTAPGPPTKEPTNVRGSGGKVGNLQIMWTPLLPEDENGEDIGYIVRWRKPGDPSWEDEKRIQGRAGLYVATVGADNFYKTYEVMVTAYNSQGDGPDSEVVTIMSAENTPQVAPTNIKAIGYNGTAVEVSWEAVPETRKGLRGKLIGYKVNYWPKDYCRGLEQIQGRNCTDFGEKMALHAVFTGPVTKAVIIGLDPMTEYTVNSMVFNSAGNGPKSDDFDCKTLKNAPLEPPTYVMIYNLDSDSVKITWRGVVVDTRLEEPVWGYKVRVWDASMHMKDAKDFKTMGSETELDIHNLKKDVQYNLRVLAFSQGGDGRQSSPIMRFVMKQGRVDSKSSMSLRSGNGAPNQRVGYDCFIKMTFMLMAVVHAFLGI